MLVQDRLPLQLVDNKFEVWITLNVPVTCVNLFQCMFLQVRNDCKLSVLMKGCLCVMVRILYGNNGL